MIVANAGHEGAVVVAKVKSNNNQNYGFNAETETFGDLVAEGVIDPTMVTRAALRNAASIASLLLTTEALVSEYPDKEASASAGSPGGMGGGMY
jgi:chaperonin GroEL